MRILKTLVRLVDQFKAACQPKNRQIVGLGRFSSGISDLGSHKKHLLRFGRSGGRR